MVKGLVSRIVRKLVHFLEYYIIEIDRNTHLPVYVSLNETTLRLVGDKYVRDCGLWYTKFIKKGNSLYSYIPNKEHIHDTYT